MYDFLCTTKNERYALQSIDEYLRTSIILYAYYKRRTERAREREREKRDRKKETKSSGVC
jgi:hypothetical protein